MAKPKVLVTGANGLIGGLTIRGLADRYEFSGFSRHPVEGIPYTIGDIRDLDLVRSAVKGQDMVLHLAGTTHNDDDWDDHFLSPPAGPSTSSVPRPRRASRDRRDEHRQHDVRLGVGRLTALRQAARGECDQVDDGSCWTTARRRAPTARTASAKLFGEAAARWFSDKTHVVLVHPAWRGPAVEPARADPPLPGLPCPGGRGPDDRQVPERAAGAPVRDLRRDLGELQADGATRPRRRRCSAGTRPDRRIASTSQR